MMKTRGRIGFTLIELLVVIAIIAILAAILFPVFMTARRSGRRAQCTSNLRQINIALTAYRDDYDGTNVYIWHGGGTTTEQDSFFFVITRYVGQNIERSDGTNSNDGAGNATRYTVYKCLSAPWLKQNFEVTSESTAEGGRTNVGFAYTMNETGWWPSDGDGAEMPWAGGRIRDSQVAIPTKLIFVAEGMGWQYYGCGYGDGTVYDNENPTGEDGHWSENPDADWDIPLSEPGYLGTHHGSRSKIYNIRVSHGGGANCMFYDGHVELRRTTKGINWTSRPVHYPK